jgi:gliding motility-associated-like protein
MFFFVHAVLKMLNVLKNTLFGKLCLLVFFPFGEAVLAQEQPQVSCLQVDELGNVTVNWTPPAANPGNFSHYEVLYSISTDLPFTSIGNNLVPFELNSFTHISNQALSNTYYYMVQAWYNDGAGGSFAVVSDTISTIYLEAEAAQNNCINCDSAAFLDWNEPMLPNNMSTENLQYQIWTDYPNGNWQLLTTVGFGVNQYVHYVYNCTPIEMNFRIRLITSDGCEFVSNIDGDLFRDSVFPTSVVVTSVEVDANEFGVVNWQPSSSSDAVGYLVYRCIGGNTNPIFQVEQEPWQFVDVFAETTYPTAEVTYSIAAFDACGNVDTTICYTSSLLTVEEYEVCDNGVSFSWTPYQGWSNDPAYYILYGAFGLTNDYTEAEMVPFDTVTTLSYYDYSLQFGGYNFYRVEAIDTINGFRAFSNFHETYVDDYAAPSYVEIQSATVLNADSVQIMLGLSPTALNFRYELQRLEESTQTWEEVLVQDASATAEIVYIDDSRATDVFSYSYRVLVFNSCGLVVDTSNVAKTILLNGEANQDRLVNVLAWSPYGDWQDGVDHYNIYRRMKDTPYELIEEVNGGGSLFYEDDISELVETDGDFFYLIEAIEKGDGSRAPFFAHSNEVNLSVDPIIWIPNAIVLGGYNPVFKPTMSFAIVEEYYLVIFSKWGDLIYETRSIEEGWDGSMNGKAVQEGVYNYYVTVKDGRGRAIDRFGNITVLNYE